MQLFGKMKMMRVALVHDDLVQWGGAERVLLAISELFPEAPIYTSVFDRDNELLQPLFVTREVRTSFIQKIPGWKSMYKMLLPLYPIAFEQFDFSEFDLVISHGTRFAKSIITKPQTKHIHYSHTPPRFLWNFSGEKAPKILAPYLSFLRLYDQISANRVDHWIAGSKNCQKRLEKVYRVESDLCQPFVDDIFFNKTESFDGDYYLIVSRLNSYKRVDIAINVFNENGQKLKIVGVGPQNRELQRLALKNIEFLGALRENMLVNLLSGCRALIVTAEEDFGLVALEAQALGKPVIAFGKGGVNETVSDGKTGIFFREQTVDNLKSALEKFVIMKNNSDNNKNQAKTFSKTRFKECFLSIIRQKTR